jgi:5'-3' exonuclease
LVDGTYELFRAHFSQRPDHTAPDGRNVKATVGVVATLLALLHDADEAPTHVAVAFDNPMMSFRNDLFAGYKTDEGVDPDLVAQLDLVEDATRALGIAVWSMRDFEADDALATGADRFASEVDQVRLLTPDKDLGQCIRGTRVVQVDRARQREIDEDALRVLRGVGPESIPDLLALIGDTADGIPGLPGFGEKTAQAVLAKFVHVDRIPDDPAEWPKVRGAERLAATLREHRDDAMLYRLLATVRTDAPITPLADIAFRGVPRAAFEAFCDDLGMTTLRARPTRWA